MQVTLTNRDAQRLLGALKTVDAGGDIKLSGKTRMAVAININRLMPIVAAFETSSQKRQLDLRPLVAEGDEAGASASLAIRAENIAIQRELIDLAGATQAYELVPITSADLDLDTNTKITGDQIAALAPMLSDLERQAQAA